MITLSPKLKRMGSVACDPCLFIPDIGMCCVVRSRDRVNGEEEGEEVEGGGEGEGEEKKDCG